MKNFLLPIIIVMLIVGGVYYYSQSTQSDSMEPEEAMMEDDSMVEEDSMMKTGSYVEFSPEAFDSASDKLRVLFFYASWCPTCRPTDANITQNEDKIPEDVVVFRVNYDNETALKQKYNVTYQHTFVQVDANGNIVTTWNGGNLAELLENIK